MLIWGIINRMKTWLLLLTFFSFFYIASAQEVSYTDKVVVINVGEHDLSNAQSFKFWRKTLERVNEENAKAVIFQLDTPGGLAFQTKDIMVNELRDLSVPSYALVDDDAISAGAMISIATDEIWMTPGSTIGAAAIVNGTGAEIEDVMRAKLESYFEANIRAVAKDKGHPVEIVKMMMFRDEEEERAYGPITVEKGKLLTLTAEEAVQDFEGKPILAKGIVKDQEELLEKIGLLQEDVVVAEQTGFEKIAWWITSISAVLILIGIGGIYFEFQTPGFGVGGAVALLAFGTFFFGNYVAGNLAGYELVALFVMGILFLLIEVLIFPNLILGFLGLCLVLGSLLFAMVDRFDLKDLGSEDIITEERVSWMDLLTAPLQSLSLGVIGGIILILILMKLLPYIPLPGFVLKTASGIDTSLPLESEVQEGLVGKEGVALMDLRPAGKAEVAGESLDVITNGEFIEKGASVRVIAEEQMRTVVEAV